VKNLFLTTHGSVSRKGAEFTLARWRNLILPKQRILELYLNVIEMGDPAFTARSPRRACYYKEPASGLDREQGRGWRPPPPLRGNQKAGPHGSFTAPRSRTACARWAGEETHYTRGLNRRQFVQLAAVLARRGRSVKPMRLAVDPRGGPGTPTPRSGKVRDLGLPTCQVEFGRLSSPAWRSSARRLGPLGVQATSAVAVGPGEEISDFYAAATHIGLVRRATRAARIPASTGPRISRRNAASRPFRRTAASSGEPQRSALQGGRRTGPQVGPYCRNNGQTFRWRDRAGDPHHVDCGPTGRGAGQRGAET